MPHTQTYTETELIQQLKQHTHAAFSYLYDHYSGALYNVILSILQDKELTNDVLQEVFIKIWKQVDQYDVNRGRLYTWLVNIARNASIDTLRSKGYNMQKQNQQITENVYEAEGGIKIETDKIGLRKIISNLKEEHRILVELAYFQGYTQDEISKTLNIPLGTVKTRMRSALIQLKYFFKP